LDLSTPHPPFFYDIEQSSQYSWREGLDLGERRITQTPTGDCSKGVQRSRNVKRPVLVG